MPAGEAEAPHIDHVDHEPVPGEVVGDLRGLNSYLNIVIGLLAVAVHDTDAGHFLRWFELAVVEADSLAAARDEAPQDFVFL